MKIFIGDYSNYIGPYQIADWFSVFGLSEEVTDKLGDFLADTPLNDFCQWLEQFNKRTEFIHIDDYDTYSMDKTLAPIILKMLQNTKTNKNGYPNCFNNEQEWDVVLDKMIWSFSEYCTDWEDQFFTGEVDFVEKPLGDDQFLLEKGPNYTARWDNEGSEAHFAKIQEGFDLFGKYYTSLWT